ncbi:MAG: glycosyltransferase family 2 protein [Pirellulales bacterium]
MTQAQPHYSATQPAERTVALSVLIAAYNEERTVGELLERVLAAALHDLEVVIVDDGSQDRTGELIARIAHRDPRVRIEGLPTNQGKTAAIARAIAAARGEVLVIQDADLEYDPAEIPRLIEPILANQADVVYGSRFLERDPTRTEYFWNRVGNRFITWWSNLFTGRKLTDVETGFKAFRAGLVKPLRFTSYGFGLEIELTAMVARTDARIGEVPISYSGRSYQEGKKISLWDGIAAARYVVYYGLFTRTSRRTREYLREANEFLAGQH